MSNSADESGQAARTSAARGPVPKTETGEALHLPPGTPVSEPPAAALSAAAEGRRTLSTAFVRAGPDGRVTVELRDGRVMTLRKLTLRATDYCGVADTSDRKVCGGYAEVVAARPGGQGAGGS